MRGGLASFVSQFDRNETAPAPKQPVSQKAVVKARSDSDESSSRENSKIVRMDEDSEEEETTQYDGIGPARSVDDLLANPILFIEYKGKDDGTSLGSKYEACNVGPLPARSSLSSSAPLTELDQNTTSPTQPVASTSKVTLDSKPSPAVSSSPAVSIAPMPMRWPTTRKRQVGTGLSNIGNTCYANSALQALIHTPALSTFLLESGYHEFGCKEKAKFCGLCSMMQIANRSLVSDSRSSYVPGPIVHNLKRLATHFRDGRQEDSHELLRFVVDSMQTACLVSHGINPKTAKPETRRTTPIYRLFGGKFRSRVTCHSCGHDSDTFDDYFDLSLDINRSTSSIREAVTNFKRIDHLRGKNKYKCEKCKKDVEAIKQFTIETSPPILTLHLKRFTPFGTKITADIEYKEHLKLDIMSDDDYMPMYRLHSVICHSGGGPHSGHYYAYVRDANGRWNRADDSSVTSCGGREWMNRSAYMLFYTRETDSMTDAVDAGLKTSNGGQGQKRKMSESMRTAMVNDGDGDGESPTKRPFIGPIKTPLTSLRTSLPTTSSSPNQLRTSPHHHNNESPKFNRPAMISSDNNDLRQPYRPPFQPQARPHHGQNAQYGKNGRSGPSRGPGSVAVGNFYGRGGGGHSARGRGQGRGRRW